MANELSTAGVLVKYAVEQAAGSRPTTGYTTIPNIRSTLTLTRSRPVWRLQTCRTPNTSALYRALKSVDGALPFLASNTNAFQTLWGTLVSAYTSAAAATPAKSVWFEIMVPGLTESFFFAGVPSPLGLGAMDVDAVAEITAYITPNLIQGWATKSTT